MRPFVRLTRAVVRVVEGLAAAALAGLALLVCLQVAGRYLLPAAPTWTEELARYLQVWLVFLAAPVCLDRGMHLAVDYLTPRLSVRRRRFAERIVLGLVGAWSLALAVLGARLLRVAALQTTPALGVSMVWPTLAVPVGGALLALVAAARFLEPASASPPGGLPAAGAGVGGTAAGAATAPGDP